MADDLYAYSWIGDFADPLAFLNGDENEGGNQNG